MPEIRDETGARDLVRRIVAKELPPKVAIPPDEEDLVKSGAVDSMGWVGILSAIEDSTGIRNFGSSWPEGHPQSILALVLAVRESVHSPRPKTTKEHSEATTRGNLAVSLLGWGHALGSLQVEAAAVERECGLPAGTIRERAGIETVRRAAPDEDETILAQRAAELALEVADVVPEAVDFAVATSATFLHLPSLAATLHTRLLLRESCAALDVGGACVGLLHALATAKAFLAMRRGVALVVASEVHSRRLSQVPGEFRGLFGDGACAFVLASSETGAGSGQGFAVGDFVFGCAGTFASSLRLALGEAGGVEVQFQGEQLGSAAVNQLGRIVDDLEIQSGEARSEVDCFAIHEPNPRLVEIFAQKAKIPLEKIPLTSKTCGNLGSATCGVSLCTALTRTATHREASRPGVIFMAAVGPGLLWGGTWLSSAGKPVCQRGASAS